MGVPSDPDDPAARSTSGAVPEVALHVVRPDEWETYRALRLEMLLDAPDAFWTTHEQAAALDEEGWRDRLRATFQVMATIDGVPVGSVGMWSPGGDEPEVTNLVALYVAPGARGRRVGERLVTAVLEEALRRGRPVVLLEVTSGNAPAGALYRRMGFRPTGRRHPHPRRADLEEVEMAWTAPGP